MVVLKGKTEKKPDRQLGVSDYGRRRLLTYADSFRELARSFREEFDYQGEDRETFLEVRRKWENKQVLKDNLNEMARIMDKVAAEVFKYRPLESRKYKLVVTALKAEGIAVTDLYYIERPGERGGIGMTMYAERAGSYTAEEVAGMLSVLLGQRLEASVTSPYQIDQEIRNYTFVEEAAYTVLTGIAKAVKENEGISGDNYSIIEFEKGKIMVILSDGMGSGEKACEASGKVLDLMEKMLEAGYSMESAVSLVNSALVAQEDEHNMSTLDICDLDLHDGYCDFLKAGAAASFVKRGSQVEQICLKSLPLGIFPAVETEMMHKDLMDGDYVILMSDGVLDALERNNYEEAMCQVIAEIDEQNPKEMADRLLQFVLHCSGGHIQDDMTIIVVGVWEKNR